MGVAGAPPPVRPAFYDGPDLHHVGPPRISFSRAEVLHLAGAVVVLSYAFALILSEPSSSFRLQDLVPEPMATLSAFLAVASGFVLHELAHKIVAQRYGHWAEFRAQFGALGLSVLLAAFFGFLVAAPGAVLIQGRVTARESAFISLVGPALNFVVALAALPFVPAVNRDDPVPLVFGMVALVNAVLAAFNLVPFGPLDGRKVWRWSKPVWAACFLASVALVVVAVMVVEGEGL